MLRRWPIQGMTQRNTHANPKKVKLGLKMLKWISSEIKGRNTMRVSQAIEWTPVPLFCLEGPRERNSQSFEQMQQKSSKCQPTFQIWFIHTFICSTFLFLSSPVPVDDEKIPCSFPLNRSEMKMVELWDGYWRRARKFYWGLATALGVPKQLYSGPVLNWN